MKLGLRRPPGFPIYAGSLSTPIFRDSPHSQTATMKRVGKHSLQAFNPAPITIPCCLRNFQLRFPNGSLNLSPVKTVPSHLSVEGRRHCQPFWQCFHTVLLMVTKTFRTNLARGAKSTPQVIVTLESAVFVAPVDQVHVSQSCPCR